MGATALRITKLKTFKASLNLQARLATSDDARRLHGKLLVLEGTGKKGREPFLIALHGSPNFTSAALLTTPPEGNAELAILTRLPPRGGGANKVFTALELGDLFGPVSDWQSLHTKPLTLPPHGDLASFVLTDATLHVAGQTVTVSVRNLPQGADRFRLLAQVEGNWLPLAEGAWSDGDTMSAPVSTLVSVDPETRLHTLSAMCLRVEILGRDGGTLAYDDAPLNVDCPHQFDTPHSCMGLVSMVAWYRFVVLFRDFTRLKSGNH